MRIPQSEDFAPSMQSQLQKGVVHKIPPLVVESNKRRKIIRQIEKDKAVRIRQREEEDFWDE